MSLLHPECEIAGKRPILTSIRVYPSLFELVFMDAMIILLFVGKHQVFLSGYTYPRNRVIVFKL